MELIILGSGTCMPMSDRASPSILLLLGGSRILLDMGPGTMRQLAKAGVGHDTIDHIFISHFHPDHTADLIHFLFVTRNPGNVKKRKPFTITGPEGLKSFIEQIGRAYKGWLDISEEIMRIEELVISKPETRQYRHYTMCSQPLSHTANSIAYRFCEDKGNTLVYSGDTGFCDGIVDLSRDCSLLILECSFPEGEEAEGHLTPSKAGRIAALACARGLVLVHFYPQVLETDITNQCRKTYQGELILGRDMLRIPV